MSEELLKTILMNQLVMMGALLAPGDNLVRRQLEEQIKHTAMVVEACDAKDDTTIMNFCQDH